jgi:hypothetical protein
LTTVAVRVFTPEPRWAVRSNTAGAIDPLENPTSTPLRDRDKKLLTAPNRTKTRRSTKVGGRVKVVR